MTFSKVVRRGLGAALLSFFVPSIASAQDNDGSVVGGIGTFLGVQWNSTARFTWGFEAFGSYQITPPPSSCPSDDRTRGGALLQMRWVGIGEPRLTLAGFVVKEFDRTDFQKSLSGELGYTIRFKDRASGLHLGAVGEMGFVVGANIALRHELFMNDTWATLGFRAFPTSGLPGWCMV